MKISGFEGFHKHLPDYSERQTKKLILRLPFFTIFFLIIQVIFLYLAQFLSKKLDSLILDFIETTVPILNNIVFVFFGSLTAQQGFLKKSELQAVNRELAFQKIVKKILMGISMVFSGILFGYIPIVNSSTSLAIILAKSFDSYFISWNISPIRYILGLIILIIAGLTALRSIQNFGIDNASMVYVYFPDEAKVIDNEIYSIVRHPMYLAVVLVSIGGFITYLSPYTLILLIITILSFYYQIVYVEEKELKERFGKSYEEYSKKKPAIFIHPRDYGVFFKFLRTNKNKNKNKNNYRKFNN